MTELSGFAKIDSVALRIEALLKRHWARGVCHTCLAAATDASFEEVHTAIQIARRRPTVIVEIDRCAICHDERVIIRTTAQRHIIDETLQPHSV